MKKKVEDETLYEVIIKFLDELTDGSQDEIFLSDNIRTINATSIEQKVELTNYANKDSQFTQIVR